MSATSGHAGLVAILAVARTALDVCVQPVAYASETAEDPEVRRVCGAVVDAVDDDCRLLHWLAARAPTLDGDREVVSALMWRESYATLRLALARVVPALTGPAPQLARLAEATGTLLDCVRAELDAAARRQTEVV